MSVIPGLEAQILEYYFLDAGTVPRITNSSADGYVNLCSASPGESGTSANEIFGRTIVDNWSGFISNEEASWTATSSGTATHFLISNVSSTTHRFYDTLATPVNFSSGDTVRMRRGKIIITCNALFSNEGAFGSTAPLYSLSRNLMMGQTVSNWQTAQMGLSTTTPNQDGTNVTEPTGGSYARVGVTWETGVFSGVGSASGGSPSTLTSTTVIQFPLATASWGTPTHWVAYNSTTSDLLYWGEIDNPAEVVNGLQPQFSIGDFVLSCD